jgi:diguanylate cyclase (GGDEF)-like protein/PAS domain S-box-containing protein
MLGKTPIDSQKMLMAVFDNMDALMGVKDKNGRFVLVNESFAKFMGKTQKYMIGKTDFDFEPEEIAEKFRADDVHVLKSLASITTEESNIDGKGCVHYILTQKKPMRFKNDEETYLFFFSVDITKQKLAEMSMRDTEERYGMLFDTMRAGFVLCEVIYGENGLPYDYKFIEVNPAYEIMNEIKKDDLAGRTMREVYPNLEQHFWDAFRDVVLTGRETRLESYSPKLEKYFSLHAFSPGKTKFAIMTRDITERKKMENALYTEKEYFRVTLQSLGDGVITTDNRQRLQLINTAAEKMTGWTQTEAQGKPFLEVFNIAHENPLLEIVNPVEEALLTDRVCMLSSHAVLTSRDMTKRHVADSAAPIKDAQGHTTGVVMVFRDETEKKRYIDDIKYLSYHDQLTGLYNRMYFEKEVKRVMKYDSPPTTIIMGDVNGLKLTNDLFGHIKGDSLLREIASIIKKCCPEYAFAARWGGDEFVICLPKTDEEQAEEVKRKIQEMCRENQEHHDKIIVPSISLGYATRKDGSADIYKLMEKAENNMYRAKLTESKKIHHYIINSIKNTLYEKSWEEQEHGQRMVHYCLKIALKLGVPPAKLDELELAAMMHDIGKITIQLNILSKPGKLTPDEWQEIKKHPEMGYRIARSAPELAGIADYILSHHERFDGTGYPQGLAGEDIPLLSRILAVADAYDSMTHSRPYKRTLSECEAKQELADNAGTQFDPRIAAAMLEVLEEEKADFSAGKAGTGRI